MVKGFFPNTEFKAFLFDFDGTIADTMSAHFTAWNQALSVHNLTLTLEQHHGWAGRPTREIVKLLSELHGKELPAEEILQFKEGHYMNSLETIKVIVPVEEVINSSYGKIPMAVVSGSRRNQVASALKILKMDHYFQLLVCAEDYVHGKPAPDCFLQAATALKVEPEDCLVFEDAVLGIQAAKAAGMQYLKVVTHDLGHKLTT